MQIGDAQHGEHGQTCPHHRWVAGSRIGSAFIGLLQLWNDDGFCFMAADHAPFMTQAFCFCGRFFVDDPLVRMSMHFALFMSAGALDPVTMRIR